MDTKILQSLMFELYKIDFNDLINFNVLSLYKLLIKIEPLFSILLNTYSDDSSNLNSIKESKLSKAQTKDRNMHLKSNLIYENIDYFSKEIDLSLLNLPQDVKIKTTFNLTNFLKSYDILSVISDNNESFLNNNNYLMMLKIAIFIVSLSSISSIKDNWIDTVSNNCNNDQISLYLDLREYLIDNSDNCYIDYELSSLEEKNTYISSINDSNQYSSKLHKNNSEQTIQKNNLIENIISKANSNNLNLDIRNSKSYLQYLNIEDSKDINYKNFFKISKSKEDEFNKLIKYFKVEIKELSKENKILNNYKTELELSLADKNRHIDQLSNLINMYKKEDIKSYEEHSFNLDKLQLEINIIEEKNKSYCNKLLNEIKELSIQNVELLEKNKYYQKLIENEQIKHQDIYNKLNIKYKDLIDEYNKLLDSTNNKNSNVSNKLNQNNKYTKDNLCVMNNCITLDIKSTINKEDLLDINKLIKDKEFYKYLNMMLNKELETIKLLLNKEKIKNLKSSENNFNNINNVSLDVACSKETFIKCNLCEVSLIQINKLNLDINKKQEIIDFYKDMLKKEKILNGIETTFLSNYIYKNNLKINNTENTQCNDAFSYNNKMYIMNMTINKYNINNVINS